MAEVVGGNSPDTEPVAVRHLTDVYTELGHALAARGQKLEAEGLWQIAKRRYAAAGRAFRDAIREWSDDLPDHRPDLRVQVARALLAERRPKEALEELLRAAEESPALAVTVLPQAESLLDASTASTLSEMADRLEAAWPQLPQDDPARVAAHRFLGAVAEKQGDLSLAIEHWQHALDLDRDDLATTEALGEALRRQGDDRGAVQLLSSAVNRADQVGNDVHRFSSRLALGRLFIDTGGYEQAREVLLIAADVHVQPDAELELALARCEMSLGRPDVALAHAELSVAADIGSSGQAQVVRAQALSALGRPAEAAATAAEALRLLPTHEGAMLLRARALLDADRELDQAVQLLKVYTQRRPGDLDGQRLLAQALWDGAGPPSDEAVAALRRIVELSATPARPAALVDLSAALLSLPGKASEAERTLVEAAEADPHVMDPRWHELRARADREQVRDRARQLTEAGDHEGAVAAWRELVALLPDDADVRISLAEQLLAAGDAATAGDMADEAAKHAYGEAYPRALELRSVALDKLQAPAADRAEALYEAGRAWYLQGVDDVNRVRKLLEQAAELRTDHAPTWWYLADVLLSASYRDQPPYVDKSAAQRGLDCWTKGAKLAEPDDEYAWVFHTRALLEDQLADLSDAEQLDRWWCGAAMLERALAIDESSWRRRAALGLQYRLLNNPHNTLQLVEGVGEGENSEVEALDEWIRSLLNIGGRDTGAERLIDRRRAIRTEGVELVVAQVRLRQHRYSEAIEIFGSALQSKPDNVWARTLYAGALMKDGQLERGRAQYEVLWNLRDDRRRGAPKMLIAWAGYQLATVGPEFSEHVLRQATALFERLCHRGERFQFTQPENLGNLGLCKLALGDLDGGAALLERQISLLSLPAEFDEIAQDLRDLRGRSAVWPHATDLCQTLDVLDESLKRGRARRLPRRRSEWELARALPTPSEPTDVAAIAATAGLARLAVAAGRLGSAAKHYRRLLRDPDDRFPEAAAALRRIGKRLVDSADQSARAENHRIAARRYAQAVAVLTEPGVGDDELLGPLRAKQFLAALGTGAERSAAKALAAAVDHLTATGSAQAYYEIGAAGIDVTAHLPAYWSADARITAFFARDANGIDPGGAAEIREGLRQYLMTILDPDDPVVDDRLPVVKPIQLDIGAALVADNTGPEWSLFKTYIPGMRDAIERDLGFTTPGVRVSQGAFADDEYVIKLDEAAVARGRVELAKRWCPRAAPDLVAAGVAEDLLMDEPDPRDGSRGCWVTQEAWPTVEAAGLPLEAEPLEFVIHDLEAVLRRNAAEFIDLQKTEELLRQWADAEGLKSLVEAVAPDAPRRLRLSRVLRTLVREGVPLTDPAALLETVRSVGLGGRSRTEVVNAARQRLRPIVPRQAYGVIVRNVPAHWEEELSSAIRPDTGGSRLEMSAERIHELTSDLNLWSGSTGSRIVLVTRRPELRPVLSALVEAAPATVIVVHRDELAEEDRGG
jgi:tetratricopeptide (TPR) repeat protein